MRPIGFCRSLFLGWARARRKIAQHCQNNHGDHPVRAEGKRGIASAALSRFSRNDTRWSHTRTFGSMPSRCIFHSDSVPSVAAEDPSWRGLPTVSRSRHRGRATTELRACYRPSRWHMTLRFPSVHIAMFVDDVGFDPTSELEDVVVRDDCCGS